MVTQLRRQTAPFLVGQGVENAFRLGLHGQDAFHGIK